MSVEVVLPLDAVRVHAELGAVARLAVDLAVGAVVDRERVQVAVARVASEAALVPHLSKQSLTDLNIQKII